ncbi:MULTISPECIES: efflux RND transporter periplasmic adaptor subunit [Methylosinus]|uniref:Efflux RND transporter periplasmic adaptor subunit n=1 Tax=Methylosinus trichosporium (strain ATCC 35070 / NCIMB 11131 / UNIQEM 75 / OB3b) TaxID=595536 RepID=A0A2D2CVJ6_METT3|nr:MULTISPECIES: efflux RND transporter periplasmic adaptor subunit [Methylosinus]ATQ66763.1 efflux RND transporter periplasmic adaptor subunit [Methylosinus trichosporium OB3b]OBS51425.1 efflux transporter periplasmic adaptor subunit [Methylosinus sp. 3S-1]
MSWSKYRLHLIIAFLAVVVALAGAYRVLQPADSNEETAQEGGPAGPGGRRGRRHGHDGPTVVTVAEPRIADVPVTIDAVGTAQALNTVTVRTQVDGRLMELGFEDGQDVRKGDVVAKIDPTLYQAAYDQAVAKKAQDEANLANARVDVVRYQKLAASNFGSQQQFATQKALVTQLEAQIRADQGAIDNAKATLDFATIRSPIDGRTGIRLVDVGNILHPSDQSGIVVITQLKPIYVVFTLPQQHLPAAQKAQRKAPAPAVALGPDNATPLDTGVVKVIDNQIDAMTGTVKVRAIFDNRRLALWPGQFVNVRLTVDTLRDAQVLPSVAVQRGPSGPFVYVLNAGENATVSMRPVVISRQDERQAVVASGVAATDKVVTSGFGRLADGSRVRVLDPAAATGEAPSAEGAPVRSRRGRGDKSAGGAAPAGAARP